MQELLQEGSQKGLSAEVNCTGLDNWTPLHFAANEGHLEIIKLLLTQKDIKVDSLSKANRTALHLACIRGHVGIVRALHEKQANINISDHEGNTALHFASENGNTDIIIFLMKECEGVNFRARNNLGQTSHEICANYDVFQMFSQLVPKEEAVNSYGRTAF